MRLFPRAARARADASGRIAWTSLTQFVRATVLVALVDAVGIMIVAAILDVPFVMAIGVLVFLGAFIPLVGATISGSVAVLVALVDQGPIVALIMLGGVIAVQQLEAHVLQPFLLGRMVSVHPLGVIVAIAVGVPRRRHRRRPGRRAARRVAQRRGGLPRLGAATRPDGDRSGADRGRAEHRRRRSHRIRRDLRSCSGAAALVAGGAAGSP